MQPWPFLCVALAFAQNALAVNQFRRPAADGPTGDYSENPAYEVGKDITFLWDTDFDQIDLVVWSDASDKLKTSLESVEQGVYLEAQFRWVSCRGEDAGGLLPDLLSGGNREAGCPVALLQHHRYVGRFGFGIGFSSSDDFKGDIDIRGDFCGHGDDTNCVLATLINIIAFSIHRCRGAARWK
ncbi:hypothetical protein K4K57_004922 [Colletotrichum sp. SAR 10_99]|nr:hypothetical protein K4K55_006618 [Colletotrichum sp. SAR 10_96]KAJ5011959.1 hypothetical protein K4K57_004922 [Colletotrichum sp. SAR 10_99]